MSLEGPMPKVVAFCIGGIDLWFWSNDHTPAHFHACRLDQWEIIVRFMLCTEDKLDFDVVWGSDPSGGDRKVLLREVLARRVALLVEWETKVVPKEER